MISILEKAIRAFNEYVIPRLPDDTFNSLSEPYIAGHSRDLAMDAVKEFEQKRRNSTLDILGESAKDNTQADTYYREYMVLIDVLSGMDLNPHNRSISVKPSAIWHFDRPGEGSRSFNQRLEQLVAHAEDKGVEITLDMEDHEYTAMSLDAAKYVWDMGHKNFGIVLQSRLNRTKKDITDLFIDGKYASVAKVRACIGIYDEPKEIATTSKKVAKERLIERIKQLFDADVYVQIATHDPKVINQILNEVIIPGHIGPDRFEFQFLKGVENAYKADRQLIGRGYKVRYYMPYEMNPGDGRKYMERRLRANPGMTLSAAKNLIQHYLPGQFHNI